MAATDDRQQRVRRGATGLDVFDTTLQKTNEWLGEIMEELHTEDRHRAYQALRGTLHAVRDRLPVDEAAHLAAQLPLLIRGAYYEGYHPAGKPITDRDRDAFLEAVSAEMPNVKGGEAIPFAQAVFKVMNRHVTSGEIDEVRQSLPHEVRDLWPMAA